MMANSSFETLPCEILEQIITSSQLSFRDVLNLSLVSSSLYQIAKSPKVWRAHFSHKYPLICNNFPLKSDWHDLCKRSYEISAITSEFIQSLSSKFWNEDEVSSEGFQPLLKLFADRADNILLVRNNLMIMYHDSEPDKNLTDKYYASKALRYLQHVQLSKEIKELLSRPEEEQHLESGAILIAKWCQPTEEINSEAVKKKIELLANEVKSYIEITDTKLFKDLSSPSPSSSPAKICKAVNHVLYNVHHFEGNMDDYHNSRNSFIDQVLIWKTGIPITLSILYQAIAARLNVKCFPVNFPRHFLLKFLDSPEASSASSNASYTYVDAFNKGRLLTENQCLSIFDDGLCLHQRKSDCFDVVSPSQVFERMAHNLVAIGRQLGQEGDNLLCLRNAAELHLAFNSSDMDSRVLLARLYIHLNINLTEVLTILQSIAGRERNAPVALICYLTSTAEKQLCEKEINNSSQIKAKHRADNLEYAVGMIMKHRRYNYYCAIYGWDLSCQASKEWIYQMGVNHLNAKDRQPFYNVLVNDGSSRYAAQENLEFTGKLQAIAHPEVGKYFSEFRGSHYICNKEKQTEYPADYDVAKKFVQKLDAHEHVPIAP